ncbi:AbrB family transcriptional regulator [Metabacillus sp. KIGAM252]|uniref:AbrB family transcriptional regulator n=1 Tax=Metabacillus flavus TaxID=2823519 RepID=A0ABS5LDK4_9BACI|nr:AbrB family transcriptional regulator [Metabacillus flavus]MBS2968786.1 AbrB family transcriptional regulator [Metabacillus flavus]
MVAASDSLKGNVGIVSVLQTIRILSVVFLIPFVVTFVLGQGDTGLQAAAAGRSFHEVHPAAFLLFAIHVLTGFFLRKILPAFYVVGSMINAAHMNIIGFPIPHLPHWLVTASQLMIGTSIGSKMSVQDLKKAGRAGLPFFIYTVLLIVLSLGLGIPFSIITSLSLETGLLCLGPC